MPRLGDIVVYHLPARDYPAVVLQANEDQTLDLCVLAAYEQGRGEIIPGSGLHYASVALARVVPEGADPYHWSSRVGSSA